MLVNRNDRPFRSALIDVLQEEKGGKPKWQHLLETLEAIEKQEARRQ